MDHVCCYGFNWNSSCLLYGPALCWYADNSKVRLQWVRARPTLCCHCIQEALEGEWWGRCDCTDWSGVRCRVIFSVPWVSHSIVSSFKNAYLFFSPSFLLPFLAPPPPPPPREFLGPLVGGGLTDVFSFATSAVLLGEVLLAMVCSCSFLWYLLLMISSLHTIMRGNDVTKWKEKEVTSTKTQDSYGAMHALPDYYQITSL